MRYSGITYLALAVAFAATLTWVHKLWRQQSVFTGKLNTSEIDYYLSDFSLSAFDSEGHSQFVLSGEHFIHQRATKTSDIYKPSIIVHTKTDTMTILAHKAQQSSSGDITLIGKVALSKPESEAHTGFELQTADLHYSPQHRLIHTDKPVQLVTSNGNTLQAVGMEEDLTTQITRLLSHVHAEYKPATTEPITH